MSVGARQRHHTHSMPPRRGDGRSAQRPRRELPGPAKKTAHFARRAAFGATPNVARPRWPSRSGTCTRAELLCARARCAESAEKVSPEALCPGYIYSAPQVLQTTDYSSPTRSRRGEGERDQLHVHCDAHRLRRDRGATSAGWHPRVPLVPPNRPTETRAPGFRCLSLLPAPPRTVLCRSPSPSTFVPWSRPFLCLPTRARDPQRSHFTVASSSRLDASCGRRRRRVRARHAPVA